MQPNIHAQLYAVVCSEHGKSKGIKKKKNTLRIQTLKEKRLVQNKR